MKTINNIIKWNFRILIGSVILSIPGNMFPESIYFLTMGSIMVASILVITIYLVGAIFYVIWKVFKHRKELWDMFKRRKEIWKWAKEKQNRN